MGKTFKHGSPSNSFRYLKRHSLEKVNNRRRARIGLKNATRAEMGDETYVMCKKFNNVKEPYKRSLRLRRPDSTTSWTNKNANVEWECDDGNTIIGDTGVNEITLLHNNTWWRNDKYIAYPICNNLFVKDFEFIGKIQLNRHREIGKTSLLHRRDNY
jgi:hypothetical protein